MFCKNKVLLTVVKAGFWWKCWGGGKLFRGGAAILAHGSHGIFFFWFFFNNLTINKIEGQDNGTEVPN
jgi:hypothetical protein